MTGILWALAILATFLVVSCTAVLIHDRVERWWNA